MFVLSYNLFHLQPNVFDLSKNICEDTREMSQPRSTAFVTINLL